MVISLAELSVPLPSVYSLPVHDTYASVISTVPPSTELPGNVMVACVSSMRETEPIDTSDGKLRSLQLDLSRDVLNAPPVSSTLILHRFRLRYMPSASSVAVIDSASLFAVTVRLFVVIDALEASSD